jgi:hypothetical protein
MALHWALWMVVGAFMAVWSASLGDKFVLFFWVGLAFVAFGFGKLLIGFMLNSNERSSKPASHPPAHSHPVHPAVRHNTVHPAHTQHPAVPGINQTHFSCPRCRYPIPPAARFCAMCGLRIR